jgi:DNA-binding LytR/AlgR family response regulator
MKILIVEDEPIFVETLLMYLEEMGYDNVHTADNATDALRLFVAVEPDLVLLDINIKGSKDGINIAEAINQSKKPVPIIFMTSIEDKSTFDRAKQTNPIAYMVKPIDEKTLERSIELAIYKYYKATWDSEFFTAWKQDVLAPHSLFIKTGQKLEKIAVQDITHIVSDASHAELYIQGSKKVARISLNDLSHKLPVDMFVRVSRSSLVNTHYIQHIDLEKNTITLPDGIEIGISRRNRDELLTRLNVV